MPERSSTELVLTPCLMIAMFEMTAKLFKMFQDRDAEKDSEDKLEDSIQFRSRL